MTSSVHSGRKSSCSCRALDRCNSITYFNPLPRNGFERADRNDYKRMRMRVLNATHKVDCQPFKLGLKKCEVQDTSIFAVKNIQERANKKITMRIVREMIAPCRIDCWNSDYVDHLYTANLQNGKKRKQQVSDSSRSNLEMMWKCSFTPPNYCRAQQLKDWENYKNKTTSRYDHVWKDPYYTTQVLSDKSIKAPTHSEETFWIKHPDPRMVDCRGGVDWDKDEMKKVLMMIDKMKCRQCPNLCD